MFTLFRNPLLKLVGRLWWLPILAPFAMWGLAGEHGKQIALSVDAVYLISLASIVGIAWGHGIFAYQRWIAGHKRRNHNFLCPTCFQFGDFLFACRKCGQRINSFPVLTRGNYVNDCPKCHAKLVRHDDGDALNLTADCRWCGSSADLALYHNRSIRILAVFHGADFAALSHALGAVQRKAGNVTYACHDDGRELTYVLHMNSVLSKQTSFPGMHGIYNIDTIWLNVAANDPLELARSIDRYVRNSGISQGGLKTLNVCMLQTELDPAARNRLTTMFESISDGVSAASLKKGNSQQAEDVLPVHEPEAAVQPAGSQLQ